jgi:flavorubredoxin
MNIHVHLNNNKNKEDLPMTASLEMPVIKAAETACDDWSVLPAWAPVSDLGVLPINAFVLRGSEPMLVDTSVGAFGDTFLASLGSVVDPADLRWIWLSHMDWDHIGNLTRVIEAAPNATVITSGLGIAKLGLVNIELSRVRLLQPGDSIDIAGRRLSAMRPVYYDAPETMGFFDESARVLFAADSFGALMPGPVDRFEDVEEATLRDGMSGWSSIDAPWLADQDAHVLARKLAAVESLQPKAVLSAHLPVARGPVRQLTGIVANAFGRIRAAA